MGTEQNLAFGVRLMKMAETVGKPKAERKKDERQESENFRALMAALEKNIEKDMDEQEKAARRIKHADDKRAQELIKMASLNTKKVEAKQKQELAKTVERNYAKRRAEELDAEKDYLKVKSEHLYRQDYDDTKEISDYYCQKHLLQQKAWLKGEQAAIPFPLPVVNKTMPAAAKPAAIKQYEG